MKVNINCLALFILACFIYSAGAEAGISVVGSLTREIHAEIGKSYQGSITIRNSGNSEQQVKVYQTDYLFYHDGSNLYDDPGTMPRSNAPWIQLSKFRLTIAPGSTKDVHYTVQVPARGLLTGTYWSMIMVEPIMETSVESKNFKPEKDKITMSLTTMVRYAVQMVTHIGDTGTGNLHFLKAYVQSEQESRILEILLENKGEKWLVPQLWIEIYDENGILMKKIKGIRTRIYPATSVKTRTDLGTVPDGNYKALVIADCGGDDVFGITYTIQL